jgi:hypothetical protein
LLTIEAITSAKKVAWKVSGAGVKVAVREPRAITVLPREAGQLRILAVAVIDGEPLIEEATVAISCGPTPTPVPPGPTPEPPKPEPIPPKPDPPRPIAKLYVLVIEETAEAVAARGAFLTHPELVRRFAEKKHQWRVIDKDVVDAFGRPPADVAPYLEQVRSRSLRLPRIWLIDQDGRVRLEDIAPATPAALLSMIDKVGG